MSGHRQAAPTPSGGREKRPFGRPCGPFGRRRAALVMRPASRRPTLLAEEPARPSDVSPFYESKYWTQGPAGTGNIGNRRFLPLVSGRGTYI